MPKIIVQQPFKFAHHGYQVEEFEPSDEARETSAECAALAIGEGWADDADALLQAQREAEERAAAEQAQREQAAGEVQTPAQPAVKRSKKAHDGAPETGAVE